MKTVMIPIGWSLRLTACLKRTKQPDLRGHDVKVTFIHTSDIHSRTLPYALDVTETDESLGLDPNSPTVGGVARAATIIRRIRASGPRVVHIDTGDVFQGAPLFNLYLGEMEFRWLRARARITTGFGRRSTPARSVARRLNTSMYSPSSLLADRAPRRPRSFEVILARALILGGHLHIVITPPEEITDCDPDPNCAGFDNVAFPGCGAHLPVSVRQSLTSLFSAFDEADWTREAFDAVTDGVAAFYEAQHTAGYSDYGSCVEDVGQAATRDCDCLTMASVERARCQARRWLNAAEMCFELPCVKIGEERRIQRIFPM